MSMNMEVKSEKPTLKLSLVIVIAVTLAVIASSFLISGSGNKEQELQQPLFETFSEIKVPDAGHGIAWSQDFEDWRLECYKTSKNGQRPCRIFQRLTQSDSGKVKKVLTAVVVTVKRKIPGRETEVSIPVMRLITPVGVHLPAGVSVQFDKKEQYGVPYQICSPAGCIAERGLGKKILDKMHGSKTMVVAYQQVEKGSSTPLVLGVSLQGFAAAFQSLVQEATP